MASALTPERRRAVVFFLLAVACALQVLAGALAMPHLLFLSLSGLGGPLLLGLLALRVTAQLSWRVVTVLSALIALVAAVGVLFAVISPLAAVGPLIILWLSWLAILPIFVWLTLYERPRHA
jgi:hypothetical protein